MTRQDPSLDPPGFRWLPALTIVAVSWLALFPVTSVDAYYHLATGRRILEERSIPTRGVGSATFGQAPWHDQEWGFQVISALIGDAEADADGVWVETSVGTVRLILMRALCLGLTLALLSATMALAGVDGLSRALGLILAAFLTFGNLFWAIRPQIFSYLLLAALVYVLERDRRGARWAGATALAVIAVWANIHGMFVVGIALLVSGLVFTAIHQVSNTLIFYLLVPRLIQVSRKPRNIPPVEMPTGLSDNFHNRISQ